MAPGAATTARDALAGRIPVTVVTGFLGSGKTTLINRLLRHPGMNRVAVVINEFGEQAIDHDLVQASSEQMMLLDNGCLCCTLRSDLQETLHRLFVKRHNGEVIDFGRVVIETSGLADPAPVMQTLLTDTLLAAHYRLDGVVTLVDAVNGPGQLDAFGEPLKQAAVADRLIITKADLAAAADLERLRDRLRGVNLRAAIAEAVDGRIAPAFLMDLGLDDTDARRARVERWLGGEPGAQDGTGVARHASGIESFCLWFDEPFAWETFTQCMGVLAALRGADLLRVKGLVNVAGEPGPLVVQGVQHLFHPPVRLAAWPGAERRSRILFITRGIPRRIVADLFAAVGAVNAGR